MREPLGKRAKVQSVTNRAEYERTRSGVALHVIIAKISNSAVNIVGRGSNFTWNHTFEITPVEEYNTRNIQETVNGKMGLGTGTLASMEIMSINDRLPTYRDLPLEEEYIIYQVTGDDEPIPNEVINAFLGAKISGRSGSHGSTGLAMQNVPFVYRKHWSGSDFKLKNAQSPYPAEVSA